MILRCFFLLCFLILFSLRVFGSLDHCSSMGSAICLSLYVCQGVCNVSLFMRFACCSGLLKVLLLERSMFRGKYTGWPKKGFANSTVQISKPSPNKKYANLYGDVWGHLLTQVPSFTFLHLLFSSFFQNLTSDPKVLPLHFSTFFKKVKLKGAGPETNRNLNEQHGVKPPNTAPPILGTLEEVDQVDRFYHAAPGLRGRPSAWMSSPPVMELRIIGYADFV